MPDIKYIEATECDACGYIITDEHTDEKDVVYHYERGREGTASVPCQHCGHIQLVSLRKHP